MKKIRILSAMQRDNAIEIIRRLPLDGAWDIVFKETSKRSLDANSKMWALLTDISRQVVWYGKKLNPEVWKQIFSASLKQSEVVPGLDNNFVVIGARTSKMTVAEFSELLELIMAFGSEHQVRFSAPEGGE